MTENRRRRAPVTAELPASIFASVSSPRSSSDLAGGGNDGDLPEAGAVIDRYRIESMLGAGGFAVVFRGRHLLLDMPVAIKLLRPQVVRRSPELVAALCEEARLAARISHANVVRVHDVHSSDAITFIVMELVDGESLSAMIARKGRLRPARVVRIGHAIASGLRAGLAEHVIHRDIKPANVIIAKSGQPKIVDLGLAIRTSDGHDDRGPTRGPVGTPGYMAPEQALDPDGVDFRADVYSLGVTLYHALVGAPPFPTDQPMRALTLHQTEAIPPPSQRVDGVPPELERLLLWMLERSPKRRPASYDVLLASLRRLQESLGPA
jgi:eukaryotic-like serine/threonine-protein kinase